MNCIDRIATFLLLPAIINNIRFQSKPMMVAKSMFDSMGKTTWWDELIGGGRVIIIRRKSLRLQDSSISDQWTVLFPSPFYQSLA